MSLIERQDIAAVVDALPRNTYDTAEGAVRVELAALYRACALYFLYLLAALAV